MQIMNNNMETHTIMARLVSGFMVQRETPVDISQYRLVF